MAKLIIVLCALVACATAKPGIVAPLAYTATVSAPLAYTVPVAAPLAYANAPLDAAYASSRVYIKQNYNAAIVPAIYAATSSVSVAASLAAPVAPIVPVAPLKYTAAPGLL